VKTCKRIDSSLQCLDDAVGFHIIKIWAWCTRRDAKLLNDITIAKSMAGQENATEMYEERRVLAVESHHQNKKPEAAALFGAKSKIFLICLHQKPNRRTESKGKRLIPRRRTK
jgi:hypothetical protein